MELVIQVLFAFHRRFVWGFLLAQLYIRPLDRKSVGADFGSCLWNEKMRVRKTFAFNLS